MFCSRSNSIAALSTVVAAMFAVLPCGAQVAAQTHIHSGAPVQGGAQVHAGAHVQAAPGVGVSAGVSGQVAPPGVGQPVPQDDRLDRDTFNRRVVAITGIAVTGSYAARKVSGVAKNAVNVGRVGQVPVWGSAVKALPIVGRSAAQGSVIPTTLGQVPVLGSVVKSVPLVGPVIAGPADPIVVGAVAIDNYVIPKYSPVGYTRSSIVAATNDFNSPPKLRHYVNYLAPLPYSHPPIYSPSTLNTDLPADLAYIDAISRSALTDAVDVPKL